MNGHSKWSVCRRMLMVDSGKHFEAYSPISCVERSEVGSIQDLSSVSMRIVCSFAQRRSRNQVGRPIFTTKSKGKQDRTGRTSELRAIREMG